MSICLPGFRLRDVRRWITVTCRFPAIFRTIRFRQSGAGQDRQALMHAFSQEIHVLYIDGPGARWLQALTRTDPKGIYCFSQLPLVRYTVVTPGYFAAMGIPLKAGRYMVDAHAHDTQPVVVINEKLARQ